MKARITEGSYPDLTVVLEPETDEERLLLRCWRMQADEPTTNGQTRGIRVGGYSLNGRPGIASLSVVIGPAAKDLPPVATLTVH